MRRIFLIEANAQTLEVAVQAVGDGPMPTVEEAERAGLVALTVIAAARKREEV